MHSNEHWTVCFIFSKMSFGGGRCWRFFLLAFSDPGESNCHTVHQRMLFLLPLAHSVELESILLSWLSALPFLHSPVGGPLHWKPVVLLWLASGSQRWEVLYYLPFTSVCSHELMSVSQQLVRSLLMASTIRPYLQCYCTRDFMCGHFLLFTERKAGKQRCTNSGFRSEVQICLVQEWCASGYGN